MKPRTIAVAMRQHTELQRTLEAVARSARKHYRALRAANPYEHPSFAARTALERASAEHSLDAYGVEGFCSDDGRHGISYLNRGDPYAATVIFRSRSERFYIGAWGDARLT